MFFFLATKCLFLIVLLVSQCSFKFETRTNRIHFNSYWRSLTHFSQISRAQIQRQNHLISAVTYILVRVRCDKVKGVLHYAIWRILIRVWQGIIVHQLRTKKRCRVFLKFEIRCFYHTYIFQFVKFLYNNNLNCHCVKNWEIRLFRSFISSFLVMDLEVPAVTVHLNRIV